MQGSGSWRMANEQNHLPARCACEDCMCSAFKLNLDSKSSIVRYAQDRAQYLYGALYRWSSLRLCFTTPPWLSKYIWLKHPGSFTKTEYFKPWAIYNSDESGQIRGQHHRDEPYISQSNGDCHLPRSHSMQAHHLRDYSRMWPRFVLFTLFQMYRSTFTVEYALKIML